MTRVLKKGFKALCSLLCIGICVYLVLSVYSAQQPDYAYTCSHVEGRAISSVDSWSECRFVSSNSVECDIQTYIHLLFEMLSDGFEIVEVKELDKDCDVIISKNMEVYRLYLENGRKLTSFSKEIEKSEQPLTYLNERKE